MRPFVYPIEPIVKAIEAWHWLPAPPTREALYFLGCFPTVGEDASVVSILSKTISHFAGQASSLGFCHVTTAQAALVTKQKAPGNGPRHMMLLASDPRDLLYLRMILEECRITLLDGAP